MNSDQKPHMFTSLKNHTKNRKRTYIVVFCLILVTAGLYGIFGRGSTADAPTETASTTVPQVTIASLGALQADGKPVVLLGEVRSVSQAELRAQKSGEVVRVNVRAGQYIPAGTVLAEIENASERAVVLQAQGALAGAQANLDRTKNGARTEDRASANAGAASAEVSLAQAKENARNVYSSALSTAQDAILSQSDTFFSNTQTVRPSFRINTSSFDERRAIEDERAAIASILDSWKTRTTVPLTDATLDSSLTEAQTNLDRLKRFLDRIAYFIAKQEANDGTTSEQIATQNAIIRGAQQSIEGARAAVSGARTGLAAAQSANTIASLSESKLVVGERTEDIQSAEAGVIQARGALAGATAALENSLIRTPIPGIVSSLSVARGDFVSMQQNIAVVANEGALEVVAYVSEDVRNTLTQGMKVLVDGQYDGVITSADPGLDPLTKRARITVGIPKDATLTNGSSVEIAIDIETGSKKTQTPAQIGWYIPIAAIKVLPNGLAVFTVTPDGTLKSEPIREGTIIGDRMLIKDPLTADLRIVTDVRGLTENEHVTIAQ